MEYEEGTMTNSKINELIRDVKEKFVGLDLGYEYMIEDEIYRIYFNKEEFCHNIEFDYYVGELMLKEYRKYFKAYFDYEEDFEKKSELNFIDSIFTA